MKFIGKEELPKTQNMHVCKLHFEKEMFNCPEDTSKCRLKFCAVPTLMDELTPSRTRRGAKDTVSII